MSRPFAGVALSICALVSGCSGDDATSSTGAELVITTPIPVVTLPPMSTVPHCGRWEDRDAQAALWRTGIESAVVVIGPSALRGRFTAYGVDVARSRIAWCFDIATRDHGAFSSVEASQFRASVGLDLDADHGVLGCVHGPGPTPPQPGEPPTLATVRNVMNTAARIDDAIARSKAALDE